MKLKSLMALAIALLCSAGAWADDVFKVVSDKFTNPSFEDAGATVAEKNSTGTLTTGWNIQAISFGRVAVFNESSTASSPYNSYGSSSPSDGSYYLMIRSNESTESTNRTQSVRQTSAMSLTKNTYRVSFHYKVAQCTGNTLTLTVSALAGSSSLAKTDIDIPQIDKSTSYFSSIEWTKGSFDLSLTEAKDIKIDITCITRSKKDGSKTTFALLDNFILEWNLTQSLTDLIGEANTFLTDEGDSEGTSYTALKSAIDAADAVKESSDADALEAQYNALSAALKLAQARKGWLAAYNTLDELDEDALPGAAKTAITDALGETEPTTIEGYNTAKDALQALIDSYAGIKAAYDKVNALILLATNEKDYSAGDADEKSTLNDAINTANTNKETRTTADDLNGDYTTLETARQTYVTSGAEPAAGYPFDWTFKLKNSSFESGTTGWTLFKETTGTWTYEAESYDPAPVDGVRCLNAWSQQINYIEVYQNVTLPMGSYSFKGYLYSTGKKAQHIYAYITSDNSSSNLSTSGSWEQLTANFTQSSSSDTSVKLGIYSQGNNINNDTYGWFRADYFQLFYNGTKPVLNDAISSANDVTTSEINVGIGDFQIPTTAKTTLEGKITEAQEVYTSGDAYGSTIQDAISTLNAAVDTFWGSELNAPAEDDVFNLYLDDGLKKTVTFKAGNETSGGYAIGYTDDAGSFYNQAIHFKSTETKNQYKLYIEDADGSKFYLCTGSVYVGGNNNQIRVTDNEENALAVEVIATTTNGIYNLKNTVAGALIGSNGDTGVYTAQKYKNFNINAAAECEVPVTVASGKWSTRIFPFAVAEIPDGLEAYMTSSVSGSSIVLSEPLSPIPANTPVLLKASKDVNETLQGYGTAKKDSYTSGLLTGFYTAIEIPADNYVLQTQDGVQAFYKLAEDATANQVYRAYLTVPAPAADVKAFYFDFNDATAISETLAPTGRAGEGPIYNLAGQKMSKLQKGVNIVNGKKVLVK